MLRYCGEILAGGAANWAHHRAQRKGPTGDGWSEHGGAVRRDRTSGMDDRGGKIFGLGLKGTGQPDEHPVADGLKFTKRHPVGGTSDRMILPLTRIGTVPHDTVATS